MARKCREQSSAYMTGKQSQTTTTLLQENSSFMNIETESKPKRLGFLDRFSINTLHLRLAKTANTSQNKPSLCLFSIFSLRPNFLEISHLLLEVSLKPNNKKKSYSKEMKRKRFKAKIYSSPLLSFFSLSTKQRFEATHQRTSNKNQENQRVNKIWV